MTHSKFPMKLWCSLIPESEMILKMVRLCRSNPLMSACTNIEGEFNYMDTPLTPLGSLPTHGITTSQRVSWVPHGANARFIGAEMKHCRGLTSCTPKTKGIITVYTFR